MKRNPKTSESAVPAPATTGFSFGSDSILPSSLRRRPSSPTAASSSAANGEQSRNQEGKKISDESLKHKQNLAKQLDVSKIFSQKMFLYICCMFSHAQIYTLICKSSNSILLFLLTKNIFIPIYLLPIQF